MNVAVIGTGYVGLVAGACFADTGNSVICVDVDAKKVAKLRGGEIPIYEPGLNTLVSRSVAEGRLTFTTSTEDAVRKAEIIFMAVGTPPTPSGDPNLSFLRDAAFAVGKAMNGYKVIVNKSTVPIGTHRQVAEWIQSHTTHPFDVVSNPEFLKEGTAVEDFLKPDRVVIGTSNKEAYEKMAALYAPFVRQGNPVIWMDPVSAEITKYACNAFLATRISFMNELALLCEKVGGNIEEIRKGMSTDVRIGKHFLYAGAGYGGSCFPKDVQALMATGRKMGVDLQIVTAAEEANDRQKHHMANQVKKHFGQNLKGLTFSVWGLAFKPNTDDMREAPALTIIEDLVAAGAKVKAFDPVASENAAEILRAKELNGSVVLCQDAYEALQGGSALLLVTEWNEFRQLDLPKASALLANKVIFDGRNIYNPSMITQAGYTYYGIGRRMT